MTSPLKHGWVPGAGLEPARPCGLGILSPLRLPASPPGRAERERLEARVGIEPAYTALQAAACPRCHRAKNKKGRCGLAGRIFPLQSGAGKESRTPDLNLGKVALYQLSYSRVDREL